MSTTKKEVQMHISTGTTPQKKSSTRVLGRLARLGVALAIVVGTTSIAVSASAVPTFEYCSPSGTVVFTATYTNSGTDTHSVKFYTAAGNEGPVDVPQGQSHVFTVDTGVASAGGFNGALISISTADGTTTDFIPLSLLTCQATSTTTAPSTTTTARVTTTTVAHHSTAAPASTAAVTATPSLTG
jgi:hypothetical protein